jgi:hypothetical protein
MRKGFLVPLAIAILAILFVLGTTLFMVSRQHLHSARFYADRESAYHVGAGCVELGVEVLESFLEFLNNPDPATFPKHENLPTELEEIGSQFFNPDGSIKEDSATSLSSTLKDSLTGSSEFSVDLRLGIKQMKLLSGPDTVGGVPPDDREAIYLFTITADVTGEGASLKVIAFKQWRIVNILLPVLGKFTLFTRDQGTLTVNGVPDTKLPADLRAIPIAINSGQSLGSTEKLSALDLKKHILSQGWIFLGGSPWSLSLSHGWGAEKYQDAFTTRGLEYYKVGEGVRSGKDSRLIQLSLNPSVGEFEWWRMITGFYKELSTTEEFEVLSHLGVDLVSYSSTLNLYGTAQNPSPTLVLGDVRRRWALLQGLFNEKNGIWAALPFLQRDEFETEPTWPGGASPSSVAIIKDNFDDDYEEYKFQMSQVIEEGYNEGILRALDLSDPAWNDRFHLECEGLESSVQDLLLLESLTVDSMNKRFCNRIVGGVYSLLDEDSKLLFEEVDLESFTNLSHLERRSAREYETFQEFLQEHVDPVSGLLDLGGVVTIKGSVNIQTPIVIAIGKGGNLLVEGNVEIGAPIQNPGREPFTIVSLGGDLKVKASSPVQASLVALEGTLFLPSRFQIEGAIASDTVVIDVPSGSLPLASERNLIYNLSLDPTKVANRNSAYRIMQDPGWSFTVQ